MKLSTDHTAGQRAVCGSTICTPIRLLGIDRGAVFVIKVFRIHSPLIFRNKAQQLKRFLKPKELVGGGILVDDGIAIAVDLPAERFSHLEIRPAAYSWLDARYSLQMIQTP